MVGNVDERGAELIETAFRCLSAAVDMVQPGAMYRDLGATIGKIAREKGEYRSSLEVGSVAIYIRERWCVFFTQQCPV